MRKLTVVFFVSICCFALSLTGCAKKELVKGEGEVSADTTATQPSTAKPEVKDEAVQESAVKEAPTVSTDEAISAEQSISLENIYFDFDSYVLTTNSRETLSKNAELLQKNSSVNIQIAGHCDERGSDEYNLALGEKRAKAALNYLTTLGVKGPRLSTISYGKEKPVDPGHDEAAWAKNRRDEFIATK
jgi:peptidoglycan-associated lipoprotein